METIQRRAAESKLASVQQEHYQLPHSFTGEKCFWGWEPAIRRHPNRSLLLT